MFNLSLFLISWIVYSILLVYSLGVLCNNISDGLKLKFYYNGLFFISFLFCVFAIISADYYSYYEFVEKVQRLIMPEDVEKVYCLLLPFIDYDFFFFRLIMVVSIFILLYYIFKNYASDNQTTLCVFVIFCLLSFSTTIRSSISDALFYIGTFSLFCRKSLIRFVLSVVCAIGACFLHKSGFMLCVPLIISFVPLNKRWVIITTGLLPVVLFATKFIMEIFVDNYFRNSPYADYQAIQSGSVMLAYYLSNFLFFIMIGYTLWESRYLLETKGFMKSLYKFMFAAYYIWIVLLTQSISRYVPARFLTHMMIPFALLVGFTYAKSKTVYRNIVIVVSMLIIATTEFSVFTKLREHLN